VSGLSVALVLVSAVLHAAWNRYVHRCDDRLAVLAVSYLSGGLLLLPWAVVNPPTQAGGWVLLSVVAHASYLRLLSSSYGRGGLSVTYPIARGLSPVLVAVGAWAWLGQAPSTATVVGVTLVTGGILVLAAVGKRAAQLDAVLVAAATGLAVTAYTLIDARAVQQVDPVAYLGLIGVVAGLGAMRSVGADVARLRSVLRPGLRIAVMQMGSYLLLLFALQRAQAAQVASLRQVSVFLGVVLAGEAFRRQTYFAGALVAAGAILIAV